MRLLKRHSHVAMMVTTVFFNTFLIFYYRCLNQGKYEFTLLKNYSKPSMLVRKRIDRVKWSKFALSVKSVNV